MNMLFYYEELYNTAAERMKALADLSANHRNKLLRQLKEHIPSLLITTGDLDAVARKMMTSLGAVLCPEAAADHAGLSKLTEMDLALRPE